MSDGHPIFHDRSYQRETISNISGTHTTNDNESLLQVNGSGYTITLHTPPGGAAAVMTIKHVGIGSITLANASIDTIEPGMVYNLTYYEASWYLLSAVDTAAAVNNNKQLYHGHSWDSVTGYEVALTYNETTRIATLTPTAGTWGSWLMGFKSDSAGTHNSVAHADTSGAWFYLINSSGGFEWRQTAWDLFTEIPIIALYYNATTKKALAVPELHKYNRNLPWHYQQHNGPGTLAAANSFALTSYALQSDAAADCAFAIGAGTCIDEDISTPLNALAAAGPYTVAYKAGVAGDWTWDSTPVLPWLSDGAGGRLYYNQDNGGTWQLTELTNNNFVNCLILARPSLSASDATRFIMVMGETDHDTLADAEAGMLTDFDLSPMFAQEYVGVAIATYRARNTYGTDGHGRIEAMTLLAQTRNLTAGGAVPVDTRKHNLTATVDPTVDDDTNDGYSNGSIWINASTDTVFMMTDSTAGAAVWANLTESALPLETELQILDITNDGTNPAYQIRANGNGVVLRDGNKVPIIGAPSDLLMDLTASGAGGLDTGTEASSTWYYMWLIHNGTTLSALLSTSVTTPTMPTGYTYKKLVGAVYNDASGNLRLFKQESDEVTYLDEYLIHDGAGLTTAAWTPLSVSAFFPLIAKRVKVHATNQAYMGLSHLSSGEGGDYQTKDDASSTNFGGVFATAAVRHYELECIYAATLYYFLDNATSHISARGFTLDIGGGL